MTNALTQAAEALRVAKEVTSATGAMEETRQINAALAAIEVEQSRVQPDRERLADECEREAGYIDDALAEQGDRVLILSTEPAKRIANKLAEAAVALRVPAAARIAELEAERDELKARLDICHRDIDALIKSTDLSEEMADKAEAERDRLRTALEECADDGFWKPKSAPILTSAAEELIRRAEIARAAIEAEQSRVPQTSGTSPGLSTARATAIAAIEGAAIALRYMGTDDAAGIIAGLAVAAEMLRAKKP